MVEGKETVLRMRGIPDNYLCPPELDCAKSCEVWALLTWDLFVGVLDVSSFSYAGDEEADPKSLISPLVFLIASRKLSLETPSFF